MFDLETLETLERRALSAMRNVSPVTGSFHDYANIVRTVETVTKAVDKAHRAMYAADAQLIDLARQQ